MDQKDSMQTGDRKMIFSMQIERMLQGLNSFNDREREREREMDKV